MSHVNEVPAMKNLYLDIDLDFFSSNQDLLTESHRIEITQEEYLRHLENP